MIRALNLLRSGLDRAFERGPRSLHDWALPQVMADTLAEVRRQHDRPEAKPIDERTIAMAVAAFRECGELPRFRDLKYVCLGAASVDRDGRCLLAEDARRDTLLELAEGVSEPRRQMKCFQGLLRSYWSFPLNDNHVPAAALAGFAILRIWLARRFIALGKVRMRKPEWFLMLSRHAHLLTDKPCERYIQALLEGDGSALQQAVDDLAIASDSWVMEEAVLAAIRSATALADDDFKGMLPRLLAIATAQAGVTLSALLSLRAIAMLLSRYARSASVSSHDPLFDAALARIGNPWRHRANWEVQVRDGHGRPDELAREMVSAWLKHSLIGDFFQLFGDEAGPATRRRDYWQRFEPFIEDMWFALAANAGGGHGQQYDDFIRRGQGLLLDRDESKEDLLIMRLSDFVAVEYGEEGNDLMLFRWDNLAPVLLRSFTPGKAGASLQDIKSIRTEARLAHREGPEKGITWERKFDEHIRPIIRRLA